LLGFIVFYNIKMCLELSILGLIQNGMSNVFLQPKQIS